MSKTKKIIITFLITMFLAGCSTMYVNNIKEDAITTNGSALSNNKICWGIKRALNHVQPDLGSKNKKIIDDYKGIAIGNKEKKYVYLTFDEGYEAGYTSRILQILKENDVKATFFLTAHYINTRRRLG